MRLLGNNVVWRVTAVCASWYEMSALTTSIASCANYQSPFPSALHCVVVCLQAKPDDFRLRGQRYCNLSCVRIVLLRRHAYTHALFSVPVDYGFSRPCQKIFPSYWTAALFLFCYENVAWSYRWIRKLIHVGHKAIHSYNKSCSWRIFHELLCPLNTYFHQRSSWCCLSIPPF